MPKLLFLALFCVVAASCSGASTVPMIRNYADGATPAKPNPQSGICRACGPCSVGGRRVTLQSESAEAATNERQTSGSGAPRPDCVWVPTPPPPLYGQFIVYAAENFENPPGHDCGSALSGDPGEGCMWSVQQVLHNADGDYLGTDVTAYNIDITIQSALSSGQATIEETYPNDMKKINATGDIVDWWSGDGQTTFSSCEADANCFEHVGICLNATCSSAIANSTTASELLGECEFSDQGSLSNPQAQDSIFSHATVIQVNS